MVGVVVSRGPLEVRVVVSEGPSDEGERLVDLTILGFFVAVIVETVAEGVDVKDFVVDVVVVGFVVVVVGVGIVFVDVIEVGDIVVSSFTSMTVVGVGNGVELNVVEVGVIVVSSVGTSPLPEVFYH